MDYRLVSQKSLYYGFFKLDRYDVEHRLFDGQMGAVVRRELLERGDAVAVLPYDPVLDEALLVEQFRIGAKDDPAGPWLIEPIAGMIDAQEAPLDVAKREAQEEAGCTLRSLTPIAEYYCSPGGCTEKVYLYCAQADLSLVKNHSVHGLKEEGEDIRVHRLPMSELQAMLMAGRLNTAMSLIATQWLVMHRLRLRAEWGVK